MCIVWLEGVEARAELLDWDLLEYSLAAAAALMADRLRGAVSAKRYSLQSFTQHSLAVASASAKLASVLQDSPGLASCTRMLSQLGDEAAKLCGFLAGLAHDHYKAFGPGEGQAFQRLVAAVLERIGVVLSEEELERLTELLYATASAVEAGATGRSVAAGVTVLAQLAGLADVLASQLSLAEAEALLAGIESRYAAALQALDGAGFELGTLRATRQSILLAEASLAVARLAAEKGCRLLLVYHDGALFLCPRGASIDYVDAARAVQSLLERVFGSKTALMELESRLRGVARLGAAAYNAYLAGDTGFREALEALEACCRGRCSAREKREAVERAVATAAAAVARGEVGAEEVVESFSRLGSCIQPRTYTGAAPKSGEELLKTHWRSLPLYIRMLVEEGRIGEAVGILSYLLGYRDKRCQVACWGGDVEEAVPGLAGLRGAKLSSGFPAVAGLILRMLSVKNASYLIQVSEKIAATSKGAKALQSFSTMYTCSSLSGTLLRGKENTCRAAIEPAAYCTVCRAPIPDLSIAAELPDYGRLLGMAKGVSELWMSDEVPGKSIEKNTALKNYGEGARRVCPACLYDAARLAEGIGVTGDKAASLVLLVYAIHPVASPEQLGLAGLALYSGARVLGSTAALGWRELAEELVNSIEESLGSAEQLLEGMVIDVFSARVLESFSALEQHAGLRLSRDARSAAYPTLEHAAVLTALAGLVLPLLGGQLLATHSLAHPRPLSSPLQAGRVLLYAEEPLRLWGYRGAAAAAMSYAMRGLWLLRGKKSAPRCMRKVEAECLALYLSQLESLAFSPTVSMVAPPSPGLHPAMPAAAVMAALNLVTEALEGVEVSLLRDLKDYAYIMCCSLLGREMTRHAVQGPLRETLSFIIEYTGVIDDKESLIGLAVGRGMDAARRRIGDTRLTPVLRRVLESIGRWFAEKAVALQPSKARQLMEALLDTVFDLAASCRYTKGMPQEVCRSLRSAASSAAGASTPSPSA